jgi:hypothetical protein
MAHCLYPTYTLMLQMWMVDTSRWLLLLLGWEELTWFPP